MSESTDDLARWAALAEAATPGPWVLDGRVVWQAGDDGEKVLGNMPRGGTIADEADLALMAEARTAVPRLLAIVAAQAEELAALHAADEYQRWARAVSERDAAREQVGRVRAVLDHAAKVSPSPAMTVYVGDVAAALDGTSDRVRGIVGGNDGGAAT